MYEIRINHYNNINNNNNNNNNDNDYDNDNVVKVDKNSKFCIYAGRPAGLIQVVKDSCYNSCKIM